MVFKDPQQTVSEEIDGHEYCNVAMSKKNIGLALGLTDESHMARSLNILIASKGIFLKKLSRSQFYVAMDTLSETDREKFETYVDQFFK